MGNNPTFDELPALADTLSGNVQMLTDIVKRQGVMITDIQRALAHLSNTEPDCWLDVNGLIEYLPDHPKRQTVYQWVCQKAIPYTKTGQRLRFRKSTIDNWLETGRRKTLAELKAAATDLQTRQYSRL